MVEETEVPHPYEKEAPTTIEVAPQKATKAPATGDIEFTPPVET